MTDNEIIKALMSKAENMVCAVADENKKTHFITNKDIANFINSQKGEIKKWQGGYMTQKQEIANLEIELKAMRGAANSYKAEIERLNNNISAMAITLRNSAKGTRAEAYKEFADRLKEKKFELDDQNEDIFYAVEVADIDNLLKELVGDNDAN